MAFETVKIYFNSLLCSLCWTQTSLCPFLTDANLLDVCLVFFLPSNVLFIRNHIIHTILCNLIGHLPLKDGKPKEQLYCVNQVTTGKLRPQEHKASGSFSSANTTTN